MRIASLQIDINVAPLSPRMRLRVRPVDARAVAARLHPGLERPQVMIRAKVPGRLAEMRQRASTHAFLERDLMFSDVLPVPAYSRKESLAREQRVEVHARI